MASLFKRLQTQSAYSYKPQQPLSLYEYKEFELQINLLDSKTLLILFSNWLSLGQSKCSCRCFVKVSAKKSK